MAGQGDKKRSGSGSELNSIFILFNTQRVTLYVQKSQAHFLTSSPCPTRAMLGAPQATNQPQIDRRDIVSVSSGSVSTDRGKHDTIHLHLTWQHSDQ